MRSPVTAAICLAVTFGAMAPSQAAEVSLEQVISREHPSFRPSVARLTIGRDGKVYLASPGNQGGYILRLDRDGSSRYGGEAVYALGNATANASGVVASANGHFAHKVTLYDAALKQTGAVD